MTYIEKQEPVYMHDAYHKQNEEGKRVTNLGPFTLCNRWPAEKFAYHIDLNTDGVPGEFVHWCLENCQGKWSWYFRQSDKNAMLTFSDPADHLLFFSEML